jgi:anaerobic ribonucleoside-triphosphate reductase activating protein
MAMINVADHCFRTEALGPGLRSVLWVQGCPFTCAGCVAPDWIEDRPEHLMTVAEVVDLLLTDDDVTGLTFSGGEPMLQAAGLAEVIRRARSRRDVSVICFTGYRLAAVRRHPDPGVHDLLGQIDVLIDGQYVERLNDGRGLRGSSNQQFHHLTNRLVDTPFDFPGQPRSVEIHIRPTSALLVGVPPDASIERSVELAAQRLTGVPAPAHTGPASSTSPSEPAQSQRARRQQ